MKFYRLEKKNYFKYYAVALLKSIGIALFVTIALMLIAGYKFMIVSSGSMEPTLPVGSLVIVTPCEYEDLQLGDIVTFEGSGINFTHRIVGKKYDTGSGYIKVEPDDPRYESATWYTKGDANNNEDGPLNKNIVGKVYENHCLTFTGLVVRYVRANYIIVIVFAIILVAFIEVLKYLREKLEPDDIECYENDEE